MAFLTRVLESPSYGFSRDGRFYAPTREELLQEFGSRLNVLRSKKNWLPFFGWAASSLLGVPALAFFIYHFHWSYTLVGFLYGAVILGTHGTVWLHRYGTHRAFQFKNAFWRFLCRNLVIKIIPEEVYVVSHHVHHQYTEQAGDPYNVHGGWLYCFLADVNHQLIARDLSEPDYQRVCKLVEHTGVRLNSYAQYRKWGSICHPAFTLCHFALNWIFWYGVFFWLGGHGLATALFGASFFWAFGVRNFNYDGHGRGKDLRRDGIDFNRKDLSVNQFWPGIVAGEWHNNHHLYPNGARSGFLPYQLDLAWIFIWTWWKFGAVSSYRDYKDEFVRNYGGELAGLRKV